MLGDPIDKLTREELVEIVNIQGAIIDDLRARLGLPEPEAALLEAVAGTRTVSTATTSHIVFNGADDAASK